MLAYYIGKDESVPRDKIGRYEATKERMGFFYVDNKRYIVVKEHLKFIDTAVELGEVKPKLFRKTIILGAKKCESITTIINKLRDSGYEVVEA